MKQESIFDQIISQLTLSDTGTQQLDKCMQFNYSLSRKVPLRYKIISIGFVRKYSLEQLNTKLQDYGLAALYARNLWEASLIYAFDHQLSYEEWKKLSASLQDIRSRQSLPHDPLQSPSVTLKMLKDYVDAGSDAASGDLLTRHLTAHIKEQLSDVHEEKAFIEFAQSNLTAFSAVREKTRYYFCKYLYYYLERKIDWYLKMSVTRQSSRLAEEERMDEISIFKGSGKIKKSTLSAEQIRESLENAPISCGILYSEFNEFFFGYVSLDWMQVLLEQVGNLKDLPARSAAKLAAAARIYDPKAYGKLSDAQILQELARQMDQQEKDLDAQYALDSPDRGYQKNRMGENSVRKYLKGELDLDRTTFLCFLLFLGSDLTSPARLYINEARMNDILRESGFRQLDEYNDFDFFIINYLRADDPSEYLMEEVTRYALSRENFYLYKLYQASRSDDADFRRLIT